MSNIIPNITISNVNEDYLRGFKDGKKAGATEWAGRAQPVIDFLEEIGNGPFPINQKELEEWLLKTKRDARTAIAKYKEVSNG